ncbi:MAG: alpha-2-macroglobulin family protein, partial [Bacteroidota bacterium]|nr:alpha-2-macroglobulin family protein [Bacteroidota bacterium]
MQKGTLDTKNGEGSFKLRVDYPEWGRYLVRVCDPESGHCTGKTVYMDWPGWAGRAQRENPGGASILSFSSDKKKYQVGEFATITFPASGAGRALVSIESGSMVVDAYWVDAQQGETTFNFKVTDQMAPNVFVNLTLLQPHAQTANDLPIRLYGVIPIMVEDPATKLNPEIQMPEVLVPEEEVTIKVKERDGKKMTYTLAIVDEGLLDLTRFKTPNPWHSFYAREALGVKTWDMYDMVLGAYGGNLDPMLAIGGGLDKEKKGDKKANRFKPMVKFIGPFELKSGGKNTHTIMMPRYVGSVRTMVVAAQDIAYGAAEKTTPVRKPLMVLATLPRVVGPEEKVVLPVSVFAMEKKVNKVTVEVKPNEFFSINGPAAKVITFDEPGDQMVNFELDVASMLGIGKVQVIAKSGKEVAKYDIELDVRAPNPRIVDVLDGMIEPGETWTTEYEPFGIEGTNKGTIEVSSIPPFNLEKRLKYLVRYPHGCIEQTTSSVFPQLFLSNLMELDSKMEAKISENVKAGIKRLYSFQLSNGGLSYWPGGNTASDWGSNYAGHFLLEAQTKGYDLPAGFLKKWIKYQKKAARNWSPNNSGSQLHYYNRKDLTQAYRLYTLAAVNSPVLGAMNRLRESRSLSVQATWRLAAAYFLAGQKEVAVELINNLTMDIEPYKELSNT